MISNFMKQLLASVLSILLLIGAASFEVAAQSPQPDYSGQGVPLTADELQQLAAPIALYPDALVAQVLAAATFPDQIATAGNWYKTYSNTGSGWDQKSGSPSSFSQSSSRGWGGQEHSGGSSAMNSGGGGWDSRTSSARGRSSWGGGGGGRFGRR